MTRALMIQTQIQSRTLAPSEARLLDNRTGFTDAQIAEFDELGLNKKGSTEATSLAPLDPQGNPAVGPSASQSGEGSSVPASQSGGA
jgi:hypothetical protein